MDTPVYNVPQTALTVRDIAIHMGDQAADYSRDFDVQLIPGDIDVLQVVVGDNEEFPVYVSATDTQVLCITYLCAESDVRPDAKTQMLEAMLEMNIPIPLSAFSRIDDRYVLFGAVSSHARHASVVNEIITLADNAIDGLSALEDYLV